MSVSGHSVRHIVHPTDFSPMSMVAFAHALQLARLARCGLSLIHVSDENEELSWGQFPGVRATLERWGLLAPESERLDVSSLGILVDKVFARGSDTLGALLDFIDHQDADLVVLGTHQYEGMDRVSHETIAESLTRRSCVPCLLIPQGIQGIVSADNGMVSLNHIIVPVSAASEPQVAVEQAANIAMLLNMPTTTFSLFHAGAPSGMPKVYPPQRAGWEWREEFGHGNPVDAIVEYVRRKNADLVVMASAGHQSIADMVRGSTTERVLRHVTCPVLVVPV